MVVQHNLQAMNANRMLNVTTGNQSKSTEKLSSGYRINRAADDAAGLSISEKMRKQIRGLDQASSNAQDGVSAVQTAEGALTEVHSMIQRMNELAVQAANGTNSKSDRDSIQDEIQQLTKEIDRVAETTKFNEIFLLKGDVNGTMKEQTINAHDAGLNGELTGVGTGTATFTKVLNAGDKVTIAGEEFEIDNSVTGGKVNSLTLKEGNAATNFGSLEKTYATTTIDLAGWKANDKISIDGTEYAQSATLDDADSIAEAYNTANPTGDFVASSNGTKLVLTAKEAGAKAGATITGTSVNGTTATATKVDGVDDSYVAFADEDEMKAAMDAGKEIKKGNKTTDPAADDYEVIYKGKDGKTTAENAYKLMAKALEEACNIGADADSKAVVVNNGDGTFTITEGKADVPEALSFNLHVGSDAAMSNKISVNIETMNAANLGIKGINVSDETGIAATYAIDAIADALARVSSQRSELGAIQNRLEHSIANLDNVVENTTSAESRIRDTDMAEEMVEYSKNNILAQAGQSMLAQANQSTQGVMSLLQ